MNKRDLVKKIAEEAGITQVAAKKALEVVLAEIAEAANKNNKFKMRGAKKNKLTFIASPIKRNTKIGRPKAAAKARPKAKAAAASAAGRPGGNTGGGGPGIRSKK